MPGGFTSPGRCRKTGPPQSLALRGDYGGPAKASVEKQIANIKAFLAEREG